MMTNQQLAGHIALLAEAEAEGNYSSLHQMIRLMSKEEFDQVRTVVSALRSEIDHVDEVISGRRSRAESQARLNRMSFGDFT